MLATLSFLTVVVAADLVIAADICEDKKPVATDAVQYVQTKVALHQRDRGEENIDRVTDKFTNATSAGKWSSAPKIGSQENFIALSDGKADSRLLGLRDWFKEALSKLPKKRLAFRRPPVRWDHPCSQKSQASEGANDKEMGAIPTGLPKIPRHLHFVLIRGRSSWINETDPSRLISKGSPKYANLTGYEQLLIENMRYTIAVHNLESVHFLDDEACKHLTGKWSRKFQQIYEGEADLRFRSDICRVAALYWEGGYYFDDDMLTYQPVQLADDTDFATALAMSGSSMFQSFLASTPCNPILARNIELMLQARSHMKIPDNLISAFEAENYLLGPVTLKLALDEKKKTLPSQKLQLFREVRHNSSYPPEPDRGGHTCEFVVIDDTGEKLHFCSRL